MEETLPSFLSLSPPSSTFFCYPPVFIIEQSISSNCNFPTRSKVAPRPAGWNKRRTPTTYRQRTTLSTMEPFDVNTIMATLKHMADARFDINTLASDPDDFDKDTPIVAVPGQKPHIPEIPSAWWWWRRPAMARTTTKCCCTAASPSWCATCSASSEPRSWAWIRGAWHCGIHAADTPRDVNNWLRNMGAVDLQPDLLQSPGPASRNHILQVGADALRHRRQQQQQQQQRQEDELTGYEEDDIDWITGGYPSSMMEVDCEHGAEKETHTHTHTERGGAGKSDHDGVTGHIRIKPPGSS